MTMEQSGKQPVPSLFKKTTDNPDGTSWLSVDLSWGTWTTGAANLVLSNSNGLSNKPVTTLVKLAFSSPTAGPVVSGAQQWVSLAQYNSQNRLFGQDATSATTPGLWSISYSNWIFNGPVAVHAPSQKLFVLAPAMSFTTLGAIVFLTITDTVNPMNQVINRN